jgi:lipid II:glycine glycyltransferase (peptidoglycan interpeptide bridge formation enzyme)
MSAAPSPIDSRQWNAAICDLPYAHVLQTTEWGVFKGRTDWSPEYLRLEGGAAMILTRRVGPLGVMYVPKGPMLNYQDSAVVERALVQIEGLARRRAIWLKIDPDVVIGTGVPGEPEAADDPIGTHIVAILKRRGWHYSTSQVQYRNTIVIDLTDSEEAILKRMSQGTRYKVRYAPKHGVTVRAGTIDDLPLLYRLYAETGARDGFLTRPYSYYEDEWGALMRAGLAQPLIAEYEGTALAHVILFRFGRTCWYFYGASSGAHRNLMATYLLQWEAMRWAKANGCTRYDLWGAPNTFDESDPMWGVYRFKEGFGGVVTRTIGAWDYTPYPALNTLYTRVMPGVIGLMKRARRATPASEGARSRSEDGS